MNGEQWEDIPEPELVSVLCDLSVVERILKEFEKEEKEKENDAA